MLLVLAACQDSGNIDSQSGEALANAYCGTCHLVPEPALLPRHKWEVVLPRMGARLGMASASFDPYADKPMDQKFLLESAQVYPDRPLLSERAWKKIQSFYYAAAPDSLVIPPQQTWETATLFQSRFPDIKTPGAPAVTMLEFDTISQRLFMADRGGHLIQFKPDFSVQDHAQLPQPIIDMARARDQHIRLLSIGKLYPDESSLGALVEMPESAFYQQELLLQRLKRPVFFLSSDLDQDEHEDFVVCAFGNDIGSLSWFEQTGTGFKETVLKNVPGATRAYAEDLDGNGWTDLMVLFGQGEEGISIFFNEEGRFREEKTLRFPAVYGTNDFEFLDFDGDGDKDIVLANGDNGDKSNVLKPYHGVRIFLNDGKLNFAQKHFFPFYGASKVRCRDFDQDGDQDLFVMSFFPDFELGGKQSLVYLQNEGEGKFTPQQIEGADQGRWMVMDAGDVDQDGDEDVVLGSFVLNSRGIDTELMKTWRTEGKRVLFLENQTVNEPQSPTLR
jgi:hypothetical protein